MLVALGAGVWVLVGLGTGALVLVGLGTGAWVLVALGAGVWVLVGLGTRALVLVGLGTGAWVLVALGAGDIVGEWTTLGEGELLVGDTAGEFTMATASNDNEMLRINIDTIKRETDLDILFWYLVIAKILNERVEIELCRNSEGSNVYL